MKVKVCGIADPGNMKAVTSLPVDLIGWIFYAGSPRNIEPTLDQLKAVHRNNAQVVGVFVNGSYEEIASAVGSHALDAVQLHGNESNALCARLRDLTTVIKVVHVATADDLKRCLDFPDADLILLETKATGWGGSGKQFDWELLAGYQAPQPFFLSGGIGPDDLNRLRTIDHPKFAGIDLNSRFETRPGMKDPELLQPFVTAIKKPFHADQR